MKSSKISERRVNKLDMLVAENLKKKRQILGMGQKDLANAVNVTVQQIQKYENAKNRISSGNLFYFAQALQVPISYFFSSGIEKERDFEAAEIWINEERMPTTAGGVISIKIKGIQFDKRKVK